MRGVIAYFVRYPIAANLLMVAILIFGYFGLMNMRSTFFPEVESRIISVQAILPGASPEEIEEGVINKIEENLKGVTGIERITSVSQENSGSITVEVLQGYDADDIVDDVRNAVDRIPSFPAGLEPPVVYKRENIGFAIAVAVSGDVSLQALKRYARQIENDLLDMEGISKVDLSGFPEEEIQVAFRENDLRAYGITFQQAAEAIRGSNLDITGGTIKTDEEELLLRSRQKDYYAAGLRDIVIKTTPQGGVVRLFQVADVTDRWADSPNRVYIDQKPAVVVTVSNTLEEDMLSITDMVKDYVESFNATHEEVKLSVTRDASTTLRDRIDLLSENGILGFFIVTLVLALFLNWRLAFWVAAAIPISFAGMFICASLLDISINVLSLFGMILVIGILVDDGIVIAENIYQRYEDGLDREDPDEAEQVLAKAEAEDRLDSLDPEAKQAGLDSRTARINRQAENAAINGTMQVLPAVVSAIATTVAAFSTFFFLRGRIGDFFSDMAAVVILSLIFSLIEGMFILPAHVAHSEALRQNLHQKPKLLAFFDRFMDFLRDRMYLPVLNFAMKQRLVTVMISVALFMITFAAVKGGLIQTTFFPNIERDELQIVLRMPAGTRESVTQVYLDRLYDAVVAADDSLSQHYFNNEKRAVEQVEVTLGPSTYQGILNVNLLDGDKRDSLKMRAFSNAVREKAGPFPEAESLTFGAASAFGKPVTVSLRGRDGKMLDAASRDVAEALRNFKGLSDITDSNQEGLREINITLNERGRALGLDESAVLGQVRAGFFGAEVQRLQRGRDEVRVWVRYAEDNRATIDQLTTMRIRTSAGEFVLGDIATLNTERGIVAINHIDGQREVSVEADIASDDVSVSDITTQLRESIVPEILRSYPGVTADFEGQNREQRKTSDSFALVAPIVLFIMLVIIALTFRSMSQTLMVSLLIPLAFIGVAWGHWWMTQITVNNYPLSLFSGLGIIALVGVLVNDALVLVTSYNEMLAAGKPQMQALRDAALGRFRPIILTTVTTLAGLGPIMFEKSLQAQFLIPMAIAVSYGLFATTVLLLAVLPSLLILGNRFKWVMHQIFTGWDGEYAHLEAASPTNSRYNWGLYFFGFVAMICCFVLLYSGLQWMRGGLTG